VDCGDWAVPLEGTVTWVGETLFPVVDRVTATEVAMAFLMRTRPRTQIKHWQKGGSRRRVLGIAKGR